MAIDTLPATGLDYEWMKEMEQTELNRGRCMVGIIMGSDSDLPIMFSAIKTLREMKFNNFETRIVSAHRTPEWMTVYGHVAAQREMKMIVAGAGGSAHLPGDMAS